MSAPSYFVELAATWPDDVRGMAVSQVGALVIADESAWAEALHGLTIGLVFAAALWRIEGMSDHARRCERERTLLAAADARDALRGLAQTALVRRAFVAAEILLEEQAGVEPAYGRVNALFEIVDELAAGDTASPYYALGIRCAVDALT